MFYFSRSLRVITLSLGLFLLNGVVAQAAITPDAPSNFITTWNTENHGESNSDQILIYIAGSPSYELYWEKVDSPSINGTTTRITENNYTHTFPEPGIYEVHASGTLSLLTFRNGKDKEKILTIEQWGDTIWGSMQQMFHGCINLRILATDAPDLSATTNMMSAFEDTPNFNQSINHWDVSNVSLFQNAFKNSGYNQPLNNWNTASATNMSNMFAGIKGFNQDISNWNIENVTDMTNMLASSTFSTANQEAMLLSWSVQNVQPGVSLNIGLQSYLVNGIFAIGSLEDLRGWNISEEYLVTYEGGPGATLSGNTSQQVLSGGSTTEVTATMKRKHQFRGWSDGATTTSRIDTNITGHQTYRVLTKKRSSSGTSASFRANHFEKHNRQEDADAIREKFNLQPKVRSEAVVKLKNSVDTLKKVPETNTHYRLLQSLIQKVEELILQLEKMK